MGDNSNGQIKVAIYTRVSTTEQAENGTSLDYQNSQLTTYCQFQNWEVVKNYVDPGFSGKDGERPGLKRLLSDAKIGIFEKVVVFKLDRLARNLTLLLDIETKLREHHVALTSMKESIDTQSSMGKMVFQLFGMVAEWERETIIERTKSGRLQRYNQGCWAGGKSLYGYSYNKDTRKLIIKEQEAQVVRRIFTAYVEGKTLGKITDDLNTERIPPRGRMSKGWRQTSVRQVLINPAYKGTEIVNRHSNISDINKIDLSKTIQFSIPPIVNEQTWQIAQDRLITNKHVKPLKQGEFLLQGLVTCGACGHAYQSDRVDGRRYYQCRGKLKVHHVDGSPRCQSKQIRAGWLEDQVWVKITDILNDPNKLADLLEDTMEKLKSREDDLSVEIDSIDKRLTEIADQKSKLADDWVVRHMKSDKFKELQNNLDREEEKLLSQRAGIDPSKIAELEETRSLIRFWEGQIKPMVWNTENEDGIMVRVVDKPHETALSLVNLEDKDLTKKFEFPSSKRGLFDKLQLKVVVFEDRIDINSLFPIDPIRCQLCTSTKGD